MLRVREHVSKIFRGQIMDVRVVGHQSSSLARRTSEVSSLPVPGQKGIFGDNAEMVSIKTEAVLVTILQ